MVERKDYEMNIYVELDTLKTMIGRMPIVIKELQNNPRYKESPRESLRRHNTQECDDDHNSFFTSKKSPLKLEVKFDFPSMMQKLISKNLIFRLNKLKYIVKFMILWMKGKIFN